MHREVTILGISAFYHDSAAAIVQGGRIVAASQEERFTRIKHDARFPSHAITACLKQGNLRLKDVDYITFYDKPLIKFERLIETYLAYAPGGFRSFLSAMPIWLKEKLFLKSVIRRELSHLSGMPEKALPPLLFNDHHNSHAASAFYPSPFDEAAVLCMDGVGEWATTTVWRGEDHSLTPQWEIQFPHSLGLLYSAFTQYAGFKVNSGEYKLMGLAPYGRPNYIAEIYDHLINVQDDGTFQLNMKYFDFPAGLSMVNECFAELFGGPVRQPETEITQKEMDLAASIQHVTEEVVLKLCQTIAHELGTDRLCLAGGVALNCVANGKLLKKGSFREIWIQPASGDAGGALGAALATHCEYLGQSRLPSKGKDLMRGAYLGPDFSEAEIITALQSKNANFVAMADDQLLPIVAELLSQGHVVGWFSGPMEFGPRSLGGRSILADPRFPDMQSKLNLKVKNRESFRPFAPVVLRERLSEWFDLDEDSPYMLYVAPVLPARRVSQPDSGEPLFGIDQLNQVRSEIPAVTHVDYSARVQTVHEETNPRFYQLLSFFEAQTGCSVLINTSFNVRGEPIVQSPEDAFDCFMSTGIDCLAIGNFLLMKEDQILAESTDLPARQFVLD